MISHLLSRADCAKCKICCKYSQGSKWDAPGFTEEELQFSKNIKEVSFTRRNNLFYLDLINVGKGEYRCQMFREGCILADNKPFKCAIWPLYIVKRQERLAIVISSICPELQKRTDEELLTAVAIIEEKIKNTIILHPELVEKDRPHFRFISYL